MIKKLVTWFLRLKDFPLCHLCHAPTENLLNDKLTCYGCEHEVMGYEYEHDAQMTMLYGDVY